MRRYGEDINGARVFVKETRFRSHEGQETREETNSFSSTQGLHARIFYNKRWAPSEQGAPPHSGRPYFTEARRDEEKVGTRETSWIITSQLAIFTMTSMPPP